MIIKTVLIAQISGLEIEIRRDNDVNTAQATFRFPDSFSAVNVGGVLSITGLLTTNDLESLAIGFDTAATM